jgi:hypothetical protein
MGARPRGAFEASWERYGALHARPPTSSPQIEKQNTNIFEMNRHHPQRLGFALLFAFLIQPFSSAPSRLMAQDQSAQEEEPEPIEWSFESEVGASIFFGASDQITVATAAGLARRSSRFDLEGDLAYLYGEATNEEGNTFVNKRSWTLGSNLNYRGFTWVNPYIFGNVLSSLEKAIEIRYKGGAGGKVTILDSDVSRLNFGLAVLGEKTVERDPDNGHSEILGRWSGEFNFRRSFSDERTVLEAKANYSPVFDQADNFTVTAESSLAFKLSEIISLKLSVVDNYDSRAKDRGARDNNDGRLLFSVLSSF